MPEEERGRFRSSVDGSGAVWRVQRAARHGGGGRAARAGSHRSRRQLTSGYASVTCKLAPRAAERHATAPRQPCYTGGTCWTVGVGALMPQVVRGPHSRVRTRAPAGVRRGGAPSPVARPRWRGSNLAASCARGRSPRKTESSQRGVRRTRAVGANGGQRRAFWVYCGERVPTHMGCMT